MGFEKATQLMNRFQLVILLLGFMGTSNSAHADDAQRTFTRERLIEAIQLMDRHFRVEKTGQYLDAIRIGDKTQSNIPSSIAATGIGLVTLALGDALGVIDNAEEKVLKTLRNLVNLDKTSGFSIKRSKSGWYPHFVDPLTGTPTLGSQNKFSTIDTALLAAGAAMAARYFNAKSFTSGAGESRIFRLTGRVVGRVRWRTAIKDVDRGLVHLIFKGRDETPSQRVFATPFDEYAILPCIAMRGEQLAGRRGKAHALFEKHYQNADELPMIDVEGISVIAKPGGSVTAHFTHQFAYFYCNRFNGQRAYRKEMRELAQADRAHFRNTPVKNVPHFLWGLGAGAEVKFNDDGSVKRTGYGVNNLKKNPHNTASPAIMAGFAAAYRSGEKGDPIVDLQKLWQTNTCRYEHQGLGFLWRCSTRNPDLKVKRVEAVDFSTYILGLAARDRAFGMPFFRNFNL